jgi:hypothetical protein
MSSPKGFAQDSRFLNIEAPELVVPYLLHAQLNEPILVGSRANPLHIRNVHKLQKTFEYFDCHCDIGFFDHDTYIGEEVKGRDVVLFTNIIRTGQKLT